MGDLLRASRRPARGPLPVWRSRRSLGHPAIGRLPLAAVSCQYNRETAADATALASHARHLCTSTCTPSLQASDPAEQRVILLAANEAPGGMSAVDGTLRCFLLGYQLCLLSSRPESAEVSSSLARAGGTAPCSHARRGLHAHPMRAEPGAVRSTALSRGKRFNPPHAMPPECSARDCARTTVALSDARSARGAGPDGSQPSSPLTPHLAHHPPHFCFPRSSPPPRLSLHLPQSHMSARSPSRHPLVPTSHHTITSSSSPRLFDHQLTHHRCNCFSPTLKLSLSSTSPTIKGGHHSMPPATCALASQFSLLDHFSSLLTPHPQLGSLCAGGENPLLRALAGGDVNQAWRELLRKRLQRLTCHRTRTPRAGAHSRSCDAAGHSSIGGGSYGEGEKACDRGGGLER